MQVLNLTIKQRYLDAILEGRKVQEMREIRPNNIAKYLQLNTEGFEIEDEYGNSLPIHYDEIHFISRENPNNFVIVEVKDAITEVFVDGDDNIITYEFGRDKNGEPLTWVAEQVVYTFGKIKDYNVTRSEKLE